jgi:hypothetical protein
LSYSKPQAQRQSYFRAIPSIQAIHLVELAARETAMWWFAVLAVCVVLLAPLTLAEVPPLLDYPNHLARLFVLAFVADDPVLTRFYVTHWGIIPNLGLDLTIPPLLRIFPIHLVGRAVVGVALLLPVFGAIAYHRALTRRQSYWPLASVLFVYNAALLRGFLNFVISLGLAMLFGAVWVRWRDSRPLSAIVIAGIGAIALFFCHLTGLLFFAILIGGYELALQSANSWSLAWTWRRVIAVGVVFAAPVLLYMMSDLGQMQGDAVFRSVTDKAGAALTPALNYFWPLDMATAVLCVAVPALCVMKRWCEIPFQAASALAVTVILFLGLPTAFKGTFDLDTRFIVMAAFLASAALVPVVPFNRPMRIIFIGFLALFGVRMAVLATVWDVQAANVAAFRSVIETVHPGDVVLTVRRRREHEFDIWSSIATPRYLSDGTVIDAHLPALLLIEHRAWWPFLFDNRSQQPIRKREPYRALAELINSTPDPVALMTNDGPDTQLVTHVLVLGPALLPEEVTQAELSLIAGNEEASLYAAPRNPISPRPPGSQPSVR